MTAPDPVSPNGAQVINNSATTFLSRGFEALTYRVSKHPDEVHFDVIIVGSGYGAAVAASHFSGCRIPGKDSDNGRATVCILERGKERLPGSFPTGFSDLPGELRLLGQQPDEPGGNAEGLFEIRAGAVASAVVANGLGGGSLINAGVMLKPDNKVLNRWPATLGGAKALDPYFVKAQRALGVLTEEDNANTIDVTEPIPLAKYQTLEQLGGRNPATQARLAQPVPITVALTPGPGAPVVTDVCINCGDCAQGCNHNAKKSLDTNLLAHAVFNKAEIFTGATVQKFDKTDTGWEVFVNHSVPTRSKRLARPVKIRCTKLIIAAGTYASNELLFRSAAESTRGLNFSDKLGCRFSGNGDNIAAITNCPTPVNMAADEALPPAGRLVGPTITGMIDQRNHGDIPMAIQELSIPAALKGLLNEVIGFVRVVHALTDKKSARQPNSDELCYVSKETLNHTAIFIMMGDDGASGKLVYNPKSKSVSLHWPEDHSTTRNKLYKSQIQLLRELAEQNFPNDAIVHDNPLRNPLGEHLQETLTIPTGPVMTVHPLGGCCIGTHAENGVVNDKGEVFTGDSAHLKDNTPRARSETYDGLVVLDGSIVPGAPGINPALSITALAIRAVELLGKKWGWQQGKFTTRKCNVKRPRYKSIPIDSAPKKRPTRVVLTERLIGKSVLKSTDGPMEVLLELSMQSAPVSIADYTNNTARAIPLETPDKSVQSNTIRIFDYRKWQQLTDPTHALKSRQQDSDANFENWLEERRKFDISPDEYLDEISLFTANITGHIELFTEIEIPALTRLTSGLSTWVTNRGARDLLNQDEKTGLLQMLKSLGKISGMKPLWIHGGRKRQLTYSLFMQTPTKVTPGFRHLVKTPVAFTGVKTFRYTPKSNPWRQMSEIELLSFPGLQDTKKPHLTLDLFYLARKKSPLLSIVEEDTLPDGYTDMTMFSMRFMRELLMHHFFSFMAPHDRILRQNKPPHHQVLLAKSWPPTDNLNSEREVYNQSALPQELKNLHYRSLWVDVDVARDDNKNTEQLSANSHFLKAHLANYTPQDRTADPTPVLLIHGYSASGTTFAHELLNPGLARYLCEQGKDVWVLDMRSSCALYSGSHAWQFEDMAYCDIPAAIQRVVTETGKPQVDIVAHCMGAVMLSIAILGGNDARAGKHVNHTLPISDSIRKIVLSQAGPILKFSAANTFRAFMMHYLKNLLPIQNFPFFPALDYAKRAALNEGNYEASTPQTTPYGVTGGDQMIDRLLATLPYPDDQEFRMEYPLFGISPHVRERHRMDILYGKTFSMRKMSSGVLQNLSDFFGPLSIETVKQTIYFANNAQITDRHGNKILRSTEAISKFWTMPTLWIHGEENGLIDPISPVLTQRLFDEANSSAENFKVKIIPYFGHQDSLMGRATATTYESIIAHLDY